MTVGVSTQRTPGKHALLRKITGRENGVTRTLGMPYVMVDLCAGDGAPTDASGTSSPQILLNHRDHARTAWGRGQHVRVALIEKRPHTFDRLAACHSSADLLIRGDAAQAGEALATLWDERTAVFIHNDPNSIRDFALSEDLVDRLPKFTTTLSTLGCNVGGLKRLTLAERLEWYGHVDLVRSTMSRHHDALIISLDRDDAQWAYLVTGPHSWRSQYVRDAEQAFQCWGKGLRMAWASNPHEFVMELDRLFLRRDEVAS